MPNLCVCGYNKGLCRLTGKAGDGADDEELPTPPLRTSQLGKHPSMQEVTGRVGTSFYMSPEVADGWARYDAKVDMYRSDPPMHKS